MNFRDDLSRIVNSLANTNFGSYNTTWQNFYIFDNGDDGEVDYLAKALKKDLQKDVRCFVGATKAVFDIADTDYVVKIPFNGGEEELNASYADEDGVYYDSENQFCLFHHANRDTGMGSVWDYCEQEEIIYHKAIEFGIGDMFAGTVKMGMIRDYPIYASERAESYSEVNYGSSSSSETVRNIFSNVNQHYVEESELYKIGEQFMEECEETEGFSSPDGMSLEFLGYMIKYYGKGKIFALCEFLYENELNDFHNSNVGFIGDRPVLIDYSGFFENY